MHTNAKRRLVAVAVAGLVTFGIATPAASAAPQERPAQVKAERSDSKAGMASKAGEKGKKATKKLSKAERMERRKQAAFAATLKKASAAGLPQEAQDALAQSVAADRDALSGASGKELREFSPARYVEAINYLRKAARLQAEVDFNAQLLADLLMPPSEPETVAASSEAVDLADAVAANAEAGAALDSAVEKALAITGTSTKDEVKAIKADLEVAEDALDVVEDIIEAYLEDMFEDDDDVDEDEEDEEDEEDDDEDDDQDEDDQDEDDDDEVTPVS